MEAPTVTSSQKKIKFKYEDQEISITLSYLSKIKINLNIINKRKTFENDFSYDDITKINRFFLMCETLKDIFDELSTLINNKIKIKFEENSLTLKIFIPSQKNKEADFVLNLKPKSLEEEIDYLNKKIVDLEQIINKQNIKISNQEKDIKMLKENKLIMETKFAELEQQIKKLHNINNVTTKRNEEEEKIDKLKKLIRRKCDLKLLYQMKTDGNLCETFHKKVDLQYPTITLFESEDGYKFGGYTSKPFKKDGGWVKDSDSFLFNFLSSKIFPIKSSNSEAIFQGNFYGPQFYDILNNSGDIKNGEINVGNFIKNKEDLKGGDLKFVNNNISVYKVEYL